MVLYKIFWSNCLLPFPFPRLLTWIPFLAMSQLPSPHTTVMEKQRVELYSLLACYNSRQTWRFSQTPDTFWRNTLRFCKHFCKHGVLTKTNCRLPLPPLSVFRGTAGRKLQLRLPAGWFTTAVHHPRKPSPCGAHKTREERNDLLFL